MSASILVVGAGGQVGSELAAATTSHRLSALTRAELDITDVDAVTQAFAIHQPDIVINAAAYTAVDKAEQDSAAAYALNCDAVGYLARACQAAGAPLLHISTDYVFSGNKLAAYSEDDAIDPLGVYGASKAAGEAVLRDVLEAHIILRTSWVFSATGNNFVKTMLRLGKERDQLGIVSDQEGCPTSAASIADVLLDIADRYLKSETVNWGTYHYCNQPETTWFDFARAIFEQAGGFDNLTVKPINTSDYPTLAKRPQNSVLDCRKLTANFSIKQVPWKEELGKVLSHLED